MKKQFINRMLSLLLSFVMVLGMLPAVAPHVHAEGTGEIVLIGPGGMAIAATVPPSDSGYTNEDLLAFYLNAGGTYILTTNGTSTDAVSLMVNTTDDITVVLDNVSFDVVQPKRSSYYYQMLNDYTATYSPSAIEIVQANDNLTVNVELKIKGVNHLKAAAKTKTTGYEPAVLQLTGVNTVISGYDSGDNVLNIRNGTVEGTTFTPNGIVATDDLTLGSGVTYNIGDYSNKDANLFIGNTAISAENLVIADGAVVNIGIDNPNGQYAICLGGKKKIEAATVNLRVTYGSAIYGATEIGDGAVLTAVSEDHYAINIIPSNPLVIGDNATVSLTSNSDNYSAVNLDNNTSFTVGENSKVTINSHSSKTTAWAVNTRRASVSVGSGSEVTVNSGYGGVYCDDLTLGDNAKLIVHADTGSGINMGGDSITVGSGATLHVSSNEAYGIYAPISNAKIHLNSGNVLVHGKKSAFYLYSSNKDFFVRGITSDEEITTYHSSDDKTWEEQDSVSWTAFTEGQIAAQWFKTVSGPHTHVYTNGYEYEADKHHYGVCICGEKAPEAEACTYPDKPYNYYPRPTATTDGTRKWKCSVCKGYWNETIPAHNCADYVKKWEDYGSEHKGVCTYLVEASGNACGVEVLADHTFTEWSGDSLTISRTCTGCGRVETKSTHENVTHMEAIAGDCSKPGRIEFWHCTDSDCGLYFSDALMTQVVAPEETFTTPGAHNYGMDGVCTVCGDIKTTVTFVPYEEDDYSSDMDGELFIFVGFKNGKAYVMGNETNADGSRNAVEIPVKPNGAIDADSATAEFFAFDFDPSPVTFSPDNGYMTALNGKIVVYDMARLDEDGLPAPINFNSSGTYDDGRGYFSNWTNKLYIVFDAETLTFKVSDTRVDSIMLYKQICSHENLYHASGAEATCTEQGVAEYWYCDDCGNYYLNGDLEAPAKPEGGGKYSPLDFTLPAFGHKFDHDVCENCGMNRHVYTQVPTLEAFDQLSEEASYIIVFKDGDKTYAAYIPDWNLFNKMITADSDGDGLIDLLETDADTNGIPDIVEAYIDTKWGGADENADGTTTADEYKQAIGSRDDDEDVDVEDYKQFFAWHIEYLLSEEFEEEHATNHSNVVEVTVADDGSITIVDEGAMEFQMMPSGIGGGQEYDDSELEYEGIKDTERLRAAWVPNYWVANYGTMGEYSEEHFLTQNRWFGDRDMPGVIDNKNWKISFNEDGTALLVSTWADFDDSAALQLVRYTDDDGNERITMVGCYDELWQNSDILSNCTVISGAYLYASEPTYCEWGPWVDDENGDTHTRECTDENCGKTQTAAHSFGKWSKLDGTNHIRSCTVCGYIEQDGHTFDEGTVVTEATCFRVGKIVYRCTAEDCDASYEEEISMTNHLWGQGEAWQDSGNGEAHIIACQNEGCNACRAELHNWVNSDEDADKHVCEMCGAEEAHSWEANVTQAPSCIAPGEGNRTCPICNAEEVFTMPIDPDAHNWGDWKVVTAPAEGMEGEEKCVCSWAPTDHVQTRPIPALEHEHVYSDWEPYDDEYHRQHCMDDTCAAYTEDKHALAEEVIQAPDYGVPGQKRVYCQTCWYEQFVEMEPLVCEKPEEGNIREIEDPSFLINSQPSESLQVVAVEVAMPATVQSPANAYDKYVLNSMDGYLVETVYDVSLQDSAGNKQNLGEDEIATVTLNIGTENAAKLENQELMLVHIQGVTRTIYVNVAPEMLDAVGEMTVNKEAGTVTFVTDSFSPFVLAALPAELEITASGKTVADGCEVTVSANASFVSNLMIAVYDKDGKMLAVAMDNGCNLSAEKTYTLQFSGTGKTVKVFLLETGTGFAPRRTAAEGTIN